MRPGSPSRRIDSKQEDQMLRQVLLAAIAAAAVASSAAPTIAQGDWETPVPRPSKSAYAPVDGVEVYCGFCGKSEPPVMVQGVLL
jgi:hypothetical protein